MTIYVVRHAWAELRDVERFPDDALRPLAPGSVRRFRRLMSKLVRRGFRPRAVATSPLVRAMQTAEVVTRQLNLPAATPRLELAPDSNLAGLLAWTHEQHGVDVAWVGHAPDVSQLVGQLIASGPVHLRFSKGAVAAIEFGEAPQPGGGQLRWLASPRVLGC